ncbi:MAG: maltooligosyltrehalose trehalohydrolase [Gaiellaceae bacterium]|nr:maltooligosyltrehalose trehalohydrolase [Gaiellaceae bacterium]
MPGEVNLGAVPNGGGAADVCVWAPSVGSLAVRSGGETTPLERDGEYWRGSFSGENYVLVADDKEWPDPCSRWQPDGVRGPSRVLGTGGFAWSDEGWQGLTLDEFVIYELHVGTFSDEGTFAGVVPRLAALRELGVTAIELMPVATFPGERGWGYDGLYTFAAHEAYGGPKELARLVDAAHAAGLGVILDVVYNHVGPGNEALSAFGPYFTDRHETFWGDAIDYAQRGVREWAIQNAEMWVREFHVDGLRLDAVHAIFDDAAPHICAELAARVRAVDSRTLVISEMEIGDWRPIEEWGHDAQWSDASHHELHVLLTCEQDGYYEDFGSVTKLAEDLRGAGHDPRRLVICAQNHDQVGNRALGDRLPEDAMRVAAAVTLFSACTPLLFMGEEWFETAPFQFFTDHIDPEIAEATREGRKKEFEAFTSFSGEDVPDPQSVETFLRSKLHPREPDPLYRELLALRRELPRELEVLEADDERKLLRLRRGNATLVADFGNRRVEFSR